jgi:CheY-like chemotaxis protein
VVCRSVGFRSWCAETLIVALTGWGQDQDRRLSTEAGFDAHFTKPVDDDALLQLLAERQAGRQGHVEPHGAPAR